MYRSLISLACLAALSGCAIVITADDGQIRHYSAFSNEVAGDGKLVLEKREIAAANSMEVNGALNVQTQIGAVSAVEVEADGNLQDKIRTESSNGVLKVWSDGYLRSKNPIRVRITLPTLQQVSRAGSGSLNISGLRGGMLEVRSSGSGTMRLDGKLNELNARLSGSGNVDAAGLQLDSAKAEIHGSGGITLGQLNGERLEAELRGSGLLRAIGKVRQLNANLYGSGDANLSGLQTERAELSTFGSGDVTVMVSQSINARTAGSGSITVYGNPAERNLSGKNIRVSG